MLHVFPLHFGHMDMRFTSSAQGIIMWATMLYRFETFFFSIPYLMGIAMRTMKNLEICSHLRQAVLKFRVVICLGPQVTQPVHSLINFQQTG